MKKCISAFLRAYHSDERRRKGMKAQKAAAGRQRKRGTVIGALACAAAVCFSSGLGGRIRADEDPEAGVTALTVQTVMLDTAEDFTAAVYLDELPETGICALDFAIAYDPAVLTIDKVDLLYDTGAQAAEIQMDPTYAGTVFTCEDVGGELRIRWATGLRNPDYWLREPQAFFTVSGSFCEGAGPGSGGALKIVPASRETFEGSGIINTEIQAGYLDSENVHHSSAVRLTDGGVWVRLDETGATRYGDMDLDGDITLTDVVLIHKMLAEESAFSAAAYANADCEFDGVLTIADMSLMLRVLKGELEAKALGAH